MIEAREWKEARERLKAYGLGTFARTAWEAAQAGWTARQVLDLVAECERHTIGGQQAWGAGALCWQLVNGEPGSRITMPPRDGYVRAKRDRELQAQRRRAGLLPRLKAMKGSELDALVAWAEERLGDRELRRQCDPLGEGLVHVGLVEARLVEVYEAFLAIESAAGGQGATPAASGG